jgi:hypothetical protein
MYKVGELELETSDRGRSGYNCVTFSPAWTGDIRTPFIAEVSVGNKSDYVRKHSRIDVSSGVPKFLIGYFSDAREAAYCVALFNKDPDTVVDIITAGRTLAKAYPVELYDLPVFITLEEAKELIQSYRNLHKPFKIALPEALAIARSMNIPTNKVKHVRAVLEDSIRAKIFVSTEHVREVISMVV